MGAGSTGLGVGGKGQPKPSKYENSIRKVATSHVKRKEKKRKQASFVFRHPMSALSHPLKVLTSEGSVSARSGGSIFTIVPDIFTSFSSSLSTGVCDKFYNAGWKQRGN